MNIRLKLSASQTDGGLDAVPQPLKNFYSFSKKLHFGNFNAI